MTSLTVQSPIGSGSNVRGEHRAPVELPAEIFDASTNVSLIHQVVVAQLAAARQGTHSTKTRGEVRGGGKKPYKQKGTGRARQGSTRAPQFAGGGVVHGPQPRSYDQRTPKKMKAAALRGALSDRARATIACSWSARWSTATCPSTKAAARDAGQGQRREAHPRGGRAARRADLEEPAQRALGAPARAGSAQHLRRARQRRRGVHQGRARRVPRRTGHRPSGKGAASSVETSATPSRPRRRRPPRMMPDVRRSP